MEMKKEDIEIFRIIEQIHKIPKDSSPLIVGNFFWTHWRNQQVPIMVLNQLVPIMGLEETEFQTHRTVMGYVGRIESEEYEFLLTLSDVIHWKATARKDVEFHWWDRAIEDTIVLRLTGFQPVPITLS